MNIIQKALDEIRYEIPNEILTQAFVDPALVRRGLPISMDTLIRQAVIEPRVMVDCNLVGGVQVTIPLNSIQPEYYDQTSMIYRIPKTLTQGRSIISVHELTIGDASLLGNASLATQESSALINAAQGMLRANLPITSPSTAYVQLVGENTVYISENYSLPSNLYLRCVIENDSSFSHIKPQSYHDFAMLCKYATKAYIYTKLAIATDTAQLHAGMALGRFKEFIDGYADANELYGTFLKDTWRKVAFFNDTESKRRHLKMISGPGR